MICIEENDSRYSNCESCHRIIPVCQKLCRGCESGENSSKGKKEEVTSPTSSPADAPTQKQLAMLKTLGVKEIPKTKREAWSKINSLKIAGGNY